MAPFSRVDRYNDNQSSLSLSKQVLLLYTLVFFLLLNRVKKNSLSLVFDLNVLASIICFNFQKTINYPIWARQFINKNDDEVIKCCSICSGVVLIVGCCWAVFVWATKLKKGPTQRFVDAAFSRSLWVDDMYGWRLNKRTGSSGANCSAREARNNPIARNRIDFFFPLFLFSG